MSRTGIKWTRIAALLFIFGGFQIFFSSRLTRQNIKSLSKVIQKDHPIKSANETAKSITDVTINGFLREADDINEALRLSSRNKFCNRHGKGSSERWRRLKTLVSKEYFLIAVDFYNNQEIAPDFFLQLQGVIKFLGTDNVHVSIYENGSGDQTKSWLHLFKIILRGLGVEHTIAMTNEKKPKFGHRITYLSKVRNNALKPLETMTRKADRVIFMNDIFFCEDDIKELLYQTYLQQSDITCGLDYDTDSEGLGFYDTWVARDITGRLFQKRPLRGFVTEHKASNDRLNDDLPFQVQCCWNGAAILNAKGFYEPSNVRFRKRDTLDLDKSSTIYKKLEKKFPNRRLYEECSSSEMNTFCKDFQLAGYTKAIIVPRVRVAYDWPTYRDLHEAVYDFKAGYTKKDEEEIEFRELPDTVVCMPMNGNALRSPDGETGEELLLIK